MWQRYEPGERRPQVLKYPPDTFQRVHKNINDIVDVVFGDPNQLEQRIDQFVVLSDKLIKLLKTPDAPDLKELRERLNRPAILAILNKEHDEKKTFLVIQGVLVNFARNSSESDSEFDAFMKRFASKAKNDPKYIEWGLKLMQSTSQ